MANSLNHLLANNYKLFKEKSLYGRWIRPSQISPLLDQLASSDLFDVEVVGKSVEGREIRFVKAGSGATTVFLWSQMHGDEATATRAIFDILNFLKATNHDLSEFREALLSNLTFYFIPILNPDGAEKYQRENALGIDLNRDGTRLAAPEAVILQAMCEKVKPDFAFNLHDQQIHHAPWSNPNPAAISLLAPPIDEVGGLNASRGKAIRLIVKMVETLSDFIPEKIGRWMDEYEPRAFGENIQQSGISTILVESGGMVGDPEKEEIRKLNFIALLMACQSIMDKTYVDKSLQVYDELPVNKLTFFDLLIKNVTVQKGKNSCVADIGIKNEMLPDFDTGKLKPKSKIEAIGDLSFFYGYEEIDGKGLNVPSDQLRLKGEANFELIRKEERVYKVKNGQVSN